eukprot:3690767-Prymnesium_polylepis.2
MAPSMRSPFGDVNRRRELDLPRSAHKPVKAGAFTEGTPGRRRDSLDLHRSAPRPARDADDQPVRGTPVQATSLLGSGAGRVRCGPREDSAELLRSPAAAGLSALLASGGARRVPVACSAEAPLEPAPCVPAPNDTPSPAHAATAATPHGTPRALLSGARRIAPDKPADDAPPPSFDFDDDEADDFLASPPAVVAASPPAPSGDALSATMQGLGSGARRTAPENPRDAAVLAPPQATSDNRPSEAQGLAVVLEPVRASVAIRGLVGSKSVLTPVRRTVRGNDGTPAADTVSLLERTNFACAVPDRTRETPPGSIHLRFPPAESWRSPIRIWQVHTQRSAASG